MDIENNRTRQCAKDKMTNERLENLLIWLEDNLQECKAKYSQTYPPSYKVLEIEDYLDPKILCAYESGRINGLEKAIILIKDHLKLEGFLLNEETISW